MFKIEMEEIDLKEEEKILIKYHELTDEVTGIINRLKTSSDKSMIGFVEDKIHRIPYKDIFYVEATENKTFIYTAHEFFETKLKLYEVENELTDGRFFRSSKSVILNASKIKYVTPSFNGRFDAKLTNDEVLGISRAYVPQLKKVLEM